MIIAIYIGKEELLSDSRFTSLLEELRDGGCDFTVLNPGEELSEGAEMLLSVGGDGTFLSSSVLAAAGNIPIIGVNLGRMGFLSENRPEDVAKALLSGDYTIENRTMLKAEVVTGQDDIDSWPYALNEMTVRRNGAAMLSVDVPMML